MAIYASSSTITTQTTPLIEVDLDAIQRDWILSWNSDKGLFTAGPASISGDGSGTYSSIEGLSLGYGSSVFVQRLGDTLQFNSITGGSGIDVTDDGSGTLTITSTVSGGGATSAENIGVGSELFKEIVDDTLRFRSLRTGSTSKNLSISQGANDITITSVAEINTGANAGTEGVGIFANKVGETLRFKNISAGQGVTITQDGNDNIIITADAATGGAVDGFNLGTGTGLFAQKLGDYLQFKSIAAGEGIQLSDNGSGTVTITSTVTSTGSEGSSNTGANVGLGWQVFKAMNGDVLEFRTIRTGTGNKHLTISQSTNELSVVSTAEINDGSNVGTQGVGIYAGKSSETLQFKNFVGGTNISVQPDLNNNIIISNTATEVKVFDATDDAKMLVVNGNTGEADPLEPGPYGTILMSGGPGATLSWTSPAVSTISRSFKVNFDATGTMSTTEDVPSDLTVNIVGNVMYVTHPFNTMLKFISYFGLDSFLNKYRYRQPTGTAGINIPAGQFNSAVEITLTGAVAGADAGTHAYVNLVF